jgi:anoctamin-10
MGAGGDGAGAVAEEEATGFEVGIVVPKLSRAAAAAQGGEDCLARLVRELEDVGLLVERVRGVPAEFIKVRCASCARYSVFEPSSPC